LPFKKPRISYVVDVLRSFEKSVILHLKKW